MSDNRIRMNKNEHKPKPWPSGDGTPLTVVTVRGIINGAEINYFTLLWFRNRVMNEI